MSVAPVALCGEVRLLWIPYASVFTLVSRIISSYWTLIQNEIMKYDTVHNRKVSMGYTSRLCSYYCLLS